MELFDVVDVVHVKRDRHTLAKPQIDWVIDAYMRDVIKDEQMAALMVTIFLCGVNREKISQWTSVIIAPDERMDFAPLARLTADKHSTGGVDGKVTLPFALLVTVFDVAVPQLSDRGLDHTGGTLDKPEPIPGRQASMSNKRIYSQLGESYGAVTCTAGASLAPANKKPYALRDITSTVNCISLTTSSIISKKIVEGIGSLVPDVKAGPGAFMKDIGQACELACMMMDLGTDADVKTFIYLTDTSAFPRLTAGSALEMCGSVKVLAGGGPADVVGPIYTFACKIFEMSGKTDADVEATPKDGHAMGVWCEMVETQGGEVDAELSTDAGPHVVFTQEDGVSRILDALSVGVVSWCLGTGRMVKKDPIQAGAGTEIHTKPGDLVKKGWSLLTLHVGDEWRILRTLESLEGGIVIGDSAPDAARVMLDEIG